MPNKKKFGGSLFIGESINGLPSPVFYDPHYANRTNLPPVTSITGSPGSGKTFAASILVAQASVMNKVVYAIDPKGDLLALKNLEKEGLINKTSVWSIFSKSKDGDEVSTDNYGLLDPLNLTDDRADNINLTIDIIEDTLPEGFQDSDRNVIPAIVKDVAESGKPVFNRVIQKLRSHQSPRIQGIGNELERIFGTQIGKLLVGSAQHDNPFSKNEGLMIISLMGLSFPPPNKKRKEFDSTEIVSMAVMKLITYSISQTMKNMTKKKQKLLFIDEAWSVINTKVGRSLINEISLLGRSLNMALIMASQSPRHFSFGLEGGDGTESALDSTISTQFAFRNDSDIDNEINRKLMKLPENEGWEDVFPKLTTGRCIMRDTTGNHAIIHIMTSKRWAKAFETNPYAKNDDDD